MCRALRVLAGNGIPRSRSTRARRSAGGSTLRSASPELARDRLPILVRLSSVNPAVGCFEDFVRTSYPAATRQILDALAQGSSLLLDGLDEAPRRHLALLLGEVDRLAAAGNQVIMTCRSVAVPRALLSSDFKLLECTGFSAIQQRRFLRQWFGARLDRRFSEDIDVAIFRDDLGQGASIKELAALSRTQRLAKLEAIRAACETYIQGNLRGQLEDLAYGAIRRTGLASGSIQVRPDEQDQQTLSVVYPAATSNRCLCAARGEDRVRR